VIAITTQNIITKKARENYNGKVLLLAVGRFETDWCFAA